MALFPPATETGPALCAPDQMFKIYHLKPPADSLEILAGKRAEVRLNEHGQGYWVLRGLAANATHDIEDPQHSSIIAFLASTGGRAGHRLHVEGHFPGGNMQSNDVFVRRVWFA